MSPLLVSALRKSYDGQRSRRRAQLRVAARRMLRPARPQRRRQDHHPALLPGADRARFGRDHAGRRTGAGAGPRSAHENRRGAAVRQPRPGLHRCRKPDRLWPLFRHERCRDPAEDCRAARFRRPDRQGRRQHPDAFRRHEAAPDAGPRAGERPRTVAAGRTDHRPRPAGAPPHLGAPASACRPRARPSC